MREQVDVKRLDKDGKVYVRARSLGRLHKECDMRPRRLKRLCQHLKDLLRQAPSRDELPLKLGAAKKEAGRAYHLLRVGLPEAD